MHAIGILSRCWDTQLLLLYFLNCTPAALSVHKYSFLFILKFLFFFLNLFFYNDLALILVSNLPGRYLETSGRLIDIKLMLLGWDPSN